MDKIVIQGGRRLKGKIKVSGAKNAALPIMASTLLTRGWNHFDNVPQLVDIHTMSNLLRVLGVVVKEGRQNLKISTDKIQSNEAPYDLVRTMRASVLVMGPLLARTGFARVSLPGGCLIGARPIDRHLKAFEEMGAEIKLEGGYVEAKAKKLKGTQIVFDDVTVTGTENVMMAATLASGITVIENAACEPEVEDLANALITMGAQIEGAGTKTITIDGVDELIGTEHEIMADRIEAGTFIMGACITGSEIIVSGIDRDYLSALISKLEETGAKIESENHGISIQGPKKLKSADVSTQPYPGFATDFQAQFMALMSVAGDTSLISENIFENRFMHAAELNRMGADIKLDGNKAIVRGVDKLLGAPVMATDLRASASLLLAGLVADDITEIHRVYHIDRGYEHIEHKFRKLGARIKRAKVKY